MIFIGFVPALIICLIIFCKDRHNPIFREKRVVNPNKEIWIWKFRTMRYDSYDHEKYFTKEQNEQWEKEHKVKNDPRVLGKLGWFLRKSSIDEFPQFVQVFSGKMSCIGPRAITKHELKFFTNNDTVSLFVMKPGITGLWQTCKDPKPKFETGDRQKTEIEYINSANLLIDIKLFFRTIVVIFEGVIKKINNI